MESPGWVRCAACTQADAQCTPAVSRINRPAPRLRAALIGWAVAAAALLAVPAPAAAQELFEVTGATRPFSSAVLRPTQQPLGTVVLVHGFLRDAASQDTLARELAAAGALVLVPELPYHADAAANARALGELITQVRAGALGALPARTVLVGFSAGGLATLLAAARTPGLTAWIGLDPVDRDGEGLHVAARVSPPATMLRARPHRCNALANSFSWGAFLPRLQRDTLIDGATHCDFQDADPVCNALCGPADATRQAAIRADVVALVLQALRGSGSSSSPGGPSG